MNKRQKKKRDRTLRLKVMLTDVEKLRKSLEDLNASVRDLARVTRRQAVELADWLYKEVDDGS